MADQPALEAAIADTGDAPEPARPPGPGWPLQLFRGVATLTALGAITQPFLAGLFLSGSFTALKAHELTGLAVGVLSVLALLSGLLYWRVGGGDNLAVRRSGVLLVVVVLQIILGYNRILALHVPIGVGIVIGSMQLAHFAWREAGR